MANYYINTVSVISDAPAATTTTSSMVPEFPNQTLAVTFAISIVIAAFLVLAVTGRAIRDSDEIAPAVKPYCDLL